MFALSNFRRHRPRVSKRPPQGARLPHETSGSGPTASGGGRATGSDGAHLGRAQQAHCGRRRSDRAQKAEQPLYRLERGAEPHEGDKVEQENVSLNGSFDS